MNTLKPISILGISAFYHDSAAALIVNGKIIAAAQEERFTRKKNDASFPSNAIQYCLDTANVTLDEIDAVAFYDKPFLKFERLLETYYGFAPRGVVSFIKSMPVWMREKIFLKKTIRDELKKIGNKKLQNIQIFFPEHHLSHAASAFFASPFKEAAILTVDGVGEWATLAISKGINNQITMLRELHFPHSLGLLYSAFTYFLGFKVNSGEYKLMGLAPYGNPESDQVKNQIQIIRNQLIDIKDDGSVWLNQRFFRYATALRMVSDRKWQRLFGFKRRLPDEKIEQKHCNLAYAIQKVTEEIILKLASFTHELTGEENLCLAGGVALNCVANGKLINEQIFKNLFVQPAAGDAGGAIGAALAVWHIQFDKERVLDHKDKMQGAFLGPSYNESEILRSVKHHKPVFEKFGSEHEKYSKVAKIISDGNVVGWFQGRMEFGPRALGNRSILADPTNPDMQKKLNLKIKYREGFRPFAPAVLSEDVSSVFELNVESPYMLLVANVKEEHRKAVPDNYYELGYMDRLYTQRSVIQSVTHVDFSARIQTVHKETNPEFYNLIREFKRLTGLGVLINTSFNIRGEPIVCSPEEAYKCFMHTDMDYLVLGNFIFDKKLQKYYKDDLSWKEYILND